MQTYLPDLKASAPHSTPAENTLTYLPDLEASAPFYITSSDIASSDIASSDIASSDIASNDIASSDIASSDIASSDIAYLVARFQSVCSPFHNPYWYCDWE
jgi:hypothetical protein